MELNANFDEPVIVHSEDLEWVPSPMPGVERRMLDRIGDEVARATTIVRYAPESQFSAHTHTGGEEFMVLDGVFQDEHGDFPACTYVRNPPTSSHTPGSKLGCTIFVKLWQFQPDDRTQIRIDTESLELTKQRNGVDAAVLFQDDLEHVSIERWEPGKTIDLIANESLELLVLSGGFYYEDEQFGRGSWLRLPVQADGTVETEMDGCRVWIKRRHLRTTPVAPSV